MDKETRATKISGRYRFICLDQYNTIVDLFARTGFVGSQHWLFSCENLCKMQRRRRINPKENEKICVATQRDKVGLDIKYINAFKGKLNDQVVQ